MRNNNPYEPTQKYPQERDGFEKSDQSYQDNGRQNIPIKFHQKKTAEENYYQQPRYQEDYDPDYRQTDF